MADRRAVVLSPEAPYPVMGGGALRTASLLEFLARSYRVDLILFQIEGGWDPRTALPPGKFGEVHVLPLPNHAKTTAARLVRNAVRLLRGVPPLVDRFAGFQDPLTAIFAKRTYELGVIEHFWCAPYAPILRPRCGKLALNLHNIESAWHQRLADSESWPHCAVHRRFARLYRSLEARWLKEFDAVLTPSAEDAAQLPVPATVYPNSIPLHAPPAAKPDLSIVFSANLEYHPNLQAMHWFHRDIWPKLRARWPHLQWRLVGRNPHAVPPEIRKDPGVVVTGPVEDAIEAIAASRAAVVPLLSGSGTRLKIIEAWAAGVPVVSTALGAEGLGAVHEEDLLVADSPEDFAAAVTRLLAEPERAARLAAAGRRRYESDYTWNAAWRQLDRAL